VSKGREDRRSQHYGKRVQHRSRIGQFPLRCWRAWAVMMFHVLRTRGQANGSLRPSLSGRKTLPIVSSFLLPACHKPDSTTTNLSSRLPLSCLSQYSLSSNRLGKLIAEKQAPE